MAEPQTDLSDAMYGASDLSRWEFHVTDDPLVRFLRDRRLARAMSALRGLGVSDMERSSMSSLVVCGGVGGEGIYLRKLGVGSVTVTDISESALQLCHSLDSGLQTLRIDAEQIDAEDRTYDLVLVQDGLHHLPRPALGLTEMLRVARRAVVVIEPHVGLVARLLGTTWEEHDGDLNFVFRWHRSLFEQATKSFLLKGDYTIKVLRFWDHNQAVGRLVHRLPTHHQLRAARALYHSLEVVRPLGNMMIGIVVKD